MGIIQSSTQCEDKCIIGHFVFKNSSGYLEIKIIYDGDNIKYNDNDIINIYNFCPCCGQELDIDMENKYMKSSSTKQLNISMVKLEKRLEYNN